MTRPCAGPGEGDPGGPQVSPGGRDAMSLLQVHDGPSLGSMVAYLAGVKFVKSAAESRPAYNLAGTLYLDPSGWLLLSVPAALIRGVFEAMREPGVELPPSGNGSKMLQPHISV